MARRIAVTAVALAAAAGAGAAALVGSAAAGPTAAVQGTVAGSYTTLQTNPDTGRAYHVSASGRTSLGHTRAAGRVSAPGNIASGRCLARLKLTTGDGTLVVAVRSTKTFKGFASCQSGFAFDWHTVSATGSYDGQSPSGTGTLTLVKASHASQTPPPAYVTFDPAA